MGFQTAQALWRDPRLLEALADPAGALLAAFRRARHVREALSEVVLIRVSLIPGGTVYCFRWL